MQSNRRLRAIFDKDVIFVQYLIAREQLERDIDAITDRLWSLSITVQLNNLTAAEAAEAVAYTDKAISSRNNNCNTIIVINNYI
jgi:hypothetical protein